MRAWFTTGRSNNTAGWGKDNEGKKFPKKLVAVRLASFCREPAADNGVDCRLEVVDLDPYLVPRVSIPECDGTILHSVVVDGDSEWYPRFISPCIPSPDGPRIVILDPKAAMELASMDPLGFLYESILVNKGIDDGLCWSDPDR